MKHINIFKSIFLLLIVFSFTTSKADTFEIESIGSATMAKSNVSEATAYELTFNVGQSETVDNLSIGLVVDHKKRQELRAVLISPNNTRVLFLNGDNSNGADDIDAVFEDTNPDIIFNSTDHNANSPYYENAVKPFSNLSVFDGENTSGTWTLKIWDYLSNSRNGSGIRAKLIIDYTPGVVLVDNDNDGVFDHLDVDDDNDGILDSLENLTYSNDFINGNFEANQSIAGTYVITDQSNVDGWETTSSDNMIEIWKSGFNNVPAYEGNFFAEINANNAARMYQNINVQPGDVVAWSVAHRGRAGVDEMHIKVGPPGNPVVQEMVTTDNTAWQVYSGTFTVPAGYTVAEIGFEAISTANGNISVGNFSDDVKLYIIGASAIDTDGDGIPNQLDLDSDNDGIMDVVEAGGSDADLNGIYANESWVDVNNNGLHDALDPAVSGILLSIVDTDNDNISDFRDIDSDGDGIIDMIEAQYTGSYAVLLNVDTDGDGIDDQFDIDQNPSIAFPLDTDNDFFPDYIDLDSDDEAEGDAIEAYDADNDGVADVIPLNQDSDNDGLDDAYDADGSSITNAAGPSNNNQDPMNFPNVDNGGEQRDWRDDQTTDGGTLPVELIAFNGQQIQQDILLEWITASEINSDYFELQKSYDLVQFEAIYRVAGAGTTSSKQYYSYSDMNENAPIVYYRLKQVDYDGKTEYSELIDFVNKVKEICISAYPNPVMDYLNIGFNFDRKAQLLFVLMDNNGRILEQKRSMTNIGLNNLMLNMQTYPSGIFYLNVFIDNQKTQQLEILKH